MPSVLLTIFVNLTLERVIRRVLTGNVAVPHLQAHRAAAVRSENVAL